jgi:hypothetical protein
VEIFARREDFPERGSMTRSSVASRQVLEYTRRALRWQRATAHRAAFLYPMMREGSGVPQAISLIGFYSCPFVFIRGYDFWEAADPT